MHTRTLYAALVGLGLVATLAPAGQAVTINPVPMILPVVWPLSATTSALNVTFSLQDCSNTATACTTQSVTAGTTPTFTLALRTATGGPIFGLTRAMTPCFGPASGFWCYNETIQWDSAVGGPYVTYGGMIMWSTGVTPANVWTGQAFTVTAKEVRLTSSINDADLPEGRAHANATWESRTHANASWCPLPACAVNGDQLVSKSYADATYEGQPHANATWESRAHANATWCPTTGCAFSGAISAPRLSVGGPVSANDLTVAGTMTTTTAWDPYVGMIVFGGITLASVLIGVWGLRQRALAAKVALVALLVIAAIWAANQTVTDNANAFRWVSVVIMSGFALLLAATAKPTRG